MDRHQEKKKKKKVMKEGWLGLPLSGLACVPYNILEGAVRSHKVSLPAYFSYISALLPLHTGNASYKSSSIWGPTLYPHPHKNILLITDFPFPPPHSSIKKI